MTPTLSPVSSQRDCGGEIPRMFVLLLTLAQVVVGQETDNLNDLHLSYETVASLAGLPLTCYNTEYPNKLNQVLANHTDLLSPSGKRNKEFFEEYTDETFRKNLQ